MSKNEKKWTELVSNLAAVLISLASLFATVSWIASSKAGGPSSDYKTAALGVMVLRLEAQTTASNYRTQAQMNVTLADVAFARSEATDNAQLKDELDQLGYSHIDAANNSIEQSKDWEDRSQSYYQDFSSKLDQAAKLGNVADARSTAALIFTAAAIVGSSGTLLKRRAVVVLSLLIFMTASGFFVWSFFM